MDSCEKNNTNFNTNSSSDQSLDTNSETKLRFSVEVFFGSLLITLLISWLALILLQILPVCKRESRLEMLKEKNKEAVVKLKDNPMEMSSTLENCANFDNNSQEFETNNSVTFDRIYVQIILIILIIISVDIQKEVLLSVVSHICELFIYFWIYAIHSSKP